MVDKVTNRLDIEVTFVVKFLLKQCHLLPT